MTHQVLPQDHAFLRGRRSRREHPCRCRPRAHLPAGAPDAQLHRQRALPGRWRGRLRRFSLALTPRRHKTRLTTMTLYHNRPGA